MTQSFVDWTEGNLVHLIKKAGVDEWYTGWNWSEHRSHARAYSTAAHAKAGYAQARKGSKTFRELNQYVIEVYRIPVSPVLLGVNVVEGTKSFLKFPAEA